MSTARINIDVGHNAAEVEREFTRVSPAIRRNINEATQAAGVHLIRALKDLDNSDGEWDSSFTTTSQGARFTASATRDSQVIRERGAKKHRIEAKAGGVLRFFWPSRQRVMFLKHVNHPGQRPHPYVERSLQAASGRISSEYDRAVKEAIE